ncbi:hypothetical protein IAD21_03988 [Abditibacteriota bacterium]|nr:hypothetical protein IAD21_03988 [Abditibacteriota bacterium]
MIIHNLTSDFYTTTESGFYILTLYIRLSNLCPPLTGGFHSLPTTSHV